MNNMIKVFVGDILVSRNILLKDTVVGACGNFQHGTDTVSGSCADLQREAIVWFSPAKVMISPKLTSISSLTFTNPFSFTGG